MKITVYADESGTHDPGGNQTGSQFPIIAGYAAFSSDWIKFCSQWKVVLNEYKAPYFHFREWSAASAAIRLRKRETPELKKNPYFGWTLKRLDSFLIQLAKVASSGNKIPVAGAINISVFNKIKEALEKDNPDNIQFGSDPYKHCMGEFFNVYHRETHLQWGEFSWPVAFIFDQNDNSKWKDALIEIFHAFQAKNSELKEIVFANKKDRSYLPLQAADMLAYRVRQHAQNIQENNFALKEMDHILLQNLLKSAEIKIRNEFHKTNPN